MGRVRKVDLGRVSLGGAWPRQAGSAVKLGWIGSSGMGWGGVGWGGVGLGGMGRSGIGWDGTEWDWVGWDLSTACLLRAYLPLDAHHLLTGYLSTTHSLQPTTNSLRNHGWLTSLCTYSTSLPLPQFLYLILIPTTPHFLNILTV